MKVKIIVNPYANRWRAQKQIPTIRKAFAELGVAYSLVETIEPQQATREAVLAVEAGFDAVVSAGGDGTLNEVVNGLVQISGDNPTLPLAVLPIGTGNDFSDMASLPRNIKAVAQLVANSKTRQVDLGVTEYDGKIHFFDNNCALAMEPLVTIEASKMKRLSGTPRYLAAVVRALAKLEAWEMQIEWEGGTHSGPIMLLSVCNGPRTGSTFMMAPDAKIDDGLFDVVLVPEVSFATVLSVLPKLLNGSHLKHRDVTYFQTSWLKISCPKGTPIHADGEVVTESAETIIYSLLPKKLTLLTP